jgi:hypothetical protein
MDMRRDLGLVVTIGTLAVSCAAPAPRPPVTRPASEPTKAALDVRSQTPMTSSPQFTTFADDVAFLGAHDQPTTEDHRRPDQG